MTEQTGNYVAEIPGIYGPVSVSERVIQKIWAGQDFAQKNLRTLCGKGLLVKHPGRWNRSDEGPDFNGAVWELEGQRVIGDVEIHFYARDWKAHGHHTDPNFKNVKLHVILFEPHLKLDDGIPTLVLGPYLREDIEGYLLRQHVQGDLGHLFEAWSERSGLEIRKTLVDGAGERWEQKLRFAKTRVEALGFEEAVHGATLEILGYRRNRAAMADVAGAYPVSTWLDAPPSLEDLIASASRPWIRSGMRPANLPEKRLGQYRNVWERAPDWILGLLNFDWPRVGFDSIPEIGALRRHVNMPEIRERLSKNIGEVIGGTRLDTLIIDGWLPLISVQLGIDLRDLWIAWYSGDFPDGFSRALSSYGVTDGRANPHANGWNQGLLQHIFTL